MERRGSRIGASVLFALLTACANPFSEYYSEQLGGRHLRDSSRLVAPEGEPQIYTTADHARDGRALLENGYVLIGYAVFNSASVDSSQAAAQARKVGAAVVLIQTKYSHTVSGTIPYTVQNPPQTVTTYHQGSVYGGGSSGGYSGTSTTTVPGGYSTYQVPYSTDRYDYGASFWAKSRPLVLGVHVGDLTDELRRQIGSNRGVVVSVVVKGSPAFDADILPGDIITRVNEDVISSGDALATSLRRYAGQEVTLSTFREGVERPVTLHLNPLSN